MRVATLAAACGLLLPLTATAQAPAAPLFASHEPLTIRLEADFDEIRGDRDQDSEERDGRAWIEAGGLPAAGIGVEIRTRGLFRLQRSTCSFPPLRLDFPRSQLAGTVLEGQDKLKLVTHCRDGDRYEQNVLEEYLIYRLYNLLTDLCFRVRLARITYVDVNEPEDAIERWGFLIEDEDALADRLGGELLDSGSVHPTQVRGRVAGPIAVFQYMIGNTDWSMYEVHNVKVIQTADGVVPVPYDFDWAGLVNARYARPAPQLGTRSVRQRVYRGLCRPDVDFAGIFERLNDLRPDLVALVETQVGLSEDGKKDFVEYLDDFYETINDPDKADRDIIGACRRV